MNRTAHRSRIPAGKAKSRCQIRNNLKARKRPVVVLKYKKNSGRLRRLRDRQLRRSFQRRRQTNRGPWTVWQTKCRSKESNSQRTTWEDPFQSCLWTQLLDKLMIHLCQRTRGRKLKGDPTRTTLLRFLKMSTLNQMRISLKMKACIVNSIKYLTIMTGNLVSAMMIR